MKCIFFLTALCTLISGLTARAPAESASDVIQTGSVWQTEGGSFILTVLDRQGDHFRCRSVATGHAGKTKIVEVTAYIRDNNILWYAKDEQVIQGGPTSDVVGTITGNKIDLILHPPSQDPYNLTLFKIFPATSGNSGNSAKADVTVYKSDDSKLKILSEQGPNVQAWVTAPLYQYVPEDIYQNMAHLQQDLLDEKEDRVKQTPALADAYAKASGLCAQFKLAIDARKAAAVAAGGPPPPLTSQLTNWRRDNLTWPMWREERDERHERQAWIKNHQGPMNDWTKVAQIWSTRLDRFYVEFRGHYRESSHGK
jgi:hypothetical protein